MSQQSIHVDLATTTEVPAVVDLLMAQERRQFASDPLVAFDEGGRVPGCALPTIWALKPDSILLSFFFLAFHKIVVVHCHEKTNFLFPGDLSQMKVGTRLQASLATIVHLPGSRPASSLTILFARKSTQFPLIETIVTTGDCHAPSGGRYAVLAHTFKWP